MVWAVIFSPGIFFIQSGTLSAQTDSPLEKRDIHVTSDSMTSERDRAFVTFNGNAIATREGIVIKADAIDVFLYTPDEKKNRARTASPETDQNINQNIKEIIARGNVKFTSEEHRAFADMAVYNTTTELLVLTGEAPKVITGKSYVTGKKITLFQKSGKVIVEGGNNQRVEALFDASDSKSDAKSGTESGAEPGTKSSAKKDKEGE